MNASPSARWAEVKEVFASTLERPGPERAAFLSEACGGDAPLRAEIEALLAAHEASSWLDVAADGLRATRSARDAPEDGRRVGAWRLVREIGRGGMGTVYLAERDGDGFRQTAALKLIKRGMDTDFVLRRFQTERQILARLAHPGIARLYDGGSTEDGLPYFVMELVEGLPIDRWCAARRLGVEERLELFRSVCAAVQHAHQSLVIHRDLKPSNILVTPAGVPKLLDFGIAKVLVPGSEAEGATATGFALMTPDHASPEQVAGAALTTASDVYALGILLVELLTGRLPRLAEPGREPERLSVTDPRLAGDLDTIAAMALRYEPERRYPSVERLADDVRRHLAELPVSARPDTLVYRASTFVKRNRMGVAAAALVLVTLVAGLVTTAWQARRAEAERARAERRYTDLRRLTSTVLFDYHDAIEALPGSTPVRERLVKDALSYLRNLELEAAGDRTLSRELAAAYLKVGDVQGRPYASNLGDAAGAERSYGAALALLDRLLREDPSDGALVRDRCVLLLRLSGLDAGALRTERSLKRATEALGTLERLAGPSPDLGDRRLVAEAVHALATASWCDVDVLTRPEVLSAALDGFRRARALREGIAADGKESPGDLWALARSEQAVGHVLLEIGRTSGKRDELGVALSHLTRAVALTERLVAASPESARARRSQADAEMVEGDGLLALSGPDAALPVYARALGTFEALLSADPTNREARHDVAFLNARLGTALSGAGRRADAVEAHDRSMRLFESLFLENAGRREDALSALHQEDRIRALTGSPRLSTAFRDACRRTGLPGLLTRADRGPS